MRSIDLSGSIRRDIVAGIYPFGSRLRIDHLAHRYGVSHMPVREALRELSGTGLIVIEPRCGARVRNVDVTLVENIFDIRSAVETMLARRAAERRTPAQLKRLEAVQARFEALVEARDYAAVLDTNRQFHDVVNEAADNPEAVHVAGEHWSVLGALWGRFGYRETRFTGVIADHRHLITALESRDSEVAGAIMGAHVAKARQDLLFQMRTAARAPGSEAAA